MNFSLWLLYRIWRGEKAVLASQIIGAHNLAYLIRASGKGKKRTGEVYDVEIACDQGKPVESPVAVVVKTDDFPICSDAEQLCRVKSAGEVNTGETARAQQEAVGVPGRIAISADDLSAIVNPSGYGARRGAGKVNAREIACAHQEAMTVSRGVVVGANDLAQVVHALKSGEGGARKVKDRKGSVV